MKPASLTRLILLPLLLFLSVVVSQAATIDDIIKEVKAELAPDKRQTVFDVSTKRLSDGSVRLSGRMSDRAIHKALIDRLRKHSGVKIVDNITLLPDDKWGLIDVSVASMRSDAKYSSEQASQLLMGMPVRLLEERNGWWYIQAPDGYLGWVWRASIANKSVDDLKRWRTADRLVVTSHYQIEAYDDPYATSPRHAVTDLVPGCIVEGSIKDSVNGRVKILLPDGREAWAAAADLTPIEVWASQDFDPDVILDQAYALKGAPYFWGGTSVKGTDCSGLVKVGYLADGIILRRDASQQILTGTRLKPEDWRTYQAGDLVFFSDKPGGRASHVGIYDADGRFIHCAGKVYVSSLDPKSPEYINRVFLGGARMHGKEGSEGITFVRDHPWYF